jgi:hypothetical protein
MFDLTNSTFSYSWATSLFGLQQVVNLITPESLRAPTRKVNAAFYPVTQTTENQFGDLLFAAYLIGDDTQRALAQLAYDMLTFRAFTPGYVANVTSAVVQQSETTFNTFSSPKNISLAWQELRNNFEVFNLVKNVGQLLHIPAGTEQFDLLKLVDQAYALGQFSDLWAVEGLGHDYTMTFWNGGKPLHGIMYEGQAAALPDKSLTMMHAGMGLAFAEQLMNTVTPYSSPTEIRGVLQKFVTLVKQNARPGYAGASYESLGLVTRFWHQQMVPFVNQFMPDVDQEAVSFFWHGVGRALYFYPLFFVPGLLSPWLAVEREPPDEMARLNMVAGLTWAMTLVNARQPEIMEKFITGAGAGESKDPGFTNGVMSSLIMGIDTTPGDVYIIGFAEYKPPDPSTAAIWNQRVGDPAKDAIYRIHPILKKHHRLGDVFHFTDLTALADRLERGGR